MTIELPSSACWAKPWTWNGVDSLTRIGSPDVMTSPANDSLRGKDLVTNFSAPIPEARSTMISVPASVIRPIVTRSASARSSTCSTMTVRCSSSSSSRMSRRAVEASAEDQRSR
jgi:hypothetical protein